MTAQLLWKQSVRVEKDKRLKRERKFSCVLSVQVSKLWIVRQLHRRVTMGRPTVSCRENCLRWHFLRCTTSQCDASLLPFLWSRRWWWCSNFLFLLSRLNGKKVSEKSKLPFKSDRFHYCWRDSPTNCDGQSGLLDRTKFAFLSEAVLWALSAWTLWCSCFCSVYSLHSGKCWRCLSFPRPAILFCLFCH